MNDCINKSPGSIIENYCMFFRILGIVFVAEILVMLLLWFIEMPTGVLEVILDAVLLSILSAPFLYLGVVRVTTKRLRAEALSTQVAREKELLATASAENMAVKAYADNIVRSVNSGLVVVSRDFNVFRVNPAFCRLFSMRPEDVEGRRIDDKFPFADIKDAIKDAFRNGSDGEDNNALEISFGGNRYFRVCVSIINPSEPDGIDSQVLLVIDDITERKLSEEKIVHLANYDSLTGLPNRRLLMDYLNQAVTLADRRQLSLAVLFIDLDNFKSINDTLGHSAGDDLLKEAAERLKKCVRLSDSVGRFGGDEFVVLLPDIEQIDDIIIICNRIYTIFNSPVILGEHQVCVMMSIGISVYPADGDDGETILRKADVAMYGAKSDGKSIYRFYADGMTQTGSGRLKLDYSLRMAAERKIYT